MLLGLLSEKMERDMAATDDARSSSELEIRELRREKQRLISRHEEELSTLQRY